MGSRRAPTGSSSGNGRNGDNGNGGSRPGGCSYLSNLRPGNRSTFCSVMAQLTEETQPSFETTLKSKAVSENCNVKFSCVVTGYPIPQVTWYKDDMQLDRYCGLPKYELFHNGQNHSLHIYNCTVEDAAIYQASAINSKGIVSCSGVLEVGEMNEFKIHERYFAKLKQKAELRRREAEGKENQEPLRTISPDRTQRKRRSTMEAFLSTPSSMEDEGNEENHQAVAVETEARLQEKATVEEAEEKLVSNGQVPTENGNKDGTYIYDAAQKSFTAHKPKTPFVKKKIKISNSAKYGKADTLGERASEERRAKDETSASVAPPCIQSVHSKGNSEEVMEVEKIVNSDDRHVTGQCQKSATQKAMLVEGPSQGENISHAPSKTEQLTDSVSPAATRTPEGQSVSGTQGDHVAKHENGAGHKETKDNLEMQKQSPDLNLKVTSTQLRSSVASTIRAVRKEAIVKTEDATAMDIDEKSDTSTNGSLAHRDLESVEPPCERRAAPPERPCEQAADKLSEKETSPCQKSVSESRPALLSEVTQAHTKNDAPVNIELPPDHCTMEAQPPQKTPSERKIVGDDTQTPSLHRGLQAAIGKMTQDIWDHSRGSNESHAVLLTDLKKSPLESLGAGEKTRECNADTAVKAVEGTEIQVDEKVEGNRLGRLIMQTDSVAPNEKIFEMETETAARDMVEKNTVVDKDAVVVVVEASREEKNEPLLKITELQNLKPKGPETAMPHFTNCPENMNTLDQLVSFNEIPKPGSKVISVAELLRSQIKALDLTLENSVQEPAITDECQGLRLDERKCKVEVKKLMPARKSETITDDNPPANIKTMLMEVYHQLNTTNQEQIQTQSKTASPVQALQNPPVIKTTRHNGSVKKFKEGDMDTGQETGVSHRPTLTDCHVVPPTGGQNAKHKCLPSITKDELTNRSVAVSRGSGTPIKASSQESNITILEHVQDERVEDKDVDLIKKLTPEIKLNGKTARGVAEMNSTTLLDTITSSLQSVKTFPAQSVLSTDPRENDIQPLQLDSSMAEDFSRSDSLTNLTPEASPLFKKRDCVSPLPSATPQELASGARRKILTPKAKPEEATEATSHVESPVPKKEASTQSSKLSASPVTPSVSPSLSRRSPLLQSPGERISPVEKCSPLLSRRKTALETEAPSQQPTEKIHNLKTEGKPTERDKHDPFKVIVSSKTLWQTPVLLESADRHDPQAPQVIRKIRGESFADASGHLKLWCQFFNVLSNSTVKWCKNEEEIARIQRNAGDETQVNLAIVQASCRDFGVYGCSITNEYGTDSTDTLLSAEILAGMSLREDLSVGEEIEMTPLLFNKGVADSGIWGNKLFGRIMMQESHIGDGCSHKVWRAKVIYGLEPVFESGNTCVIKVRNPIAYGGKEESGLIERNLDIVKQECKIQNLAREYCKIFSAEARVIESFGPSLEVIPVHLMYRPANTVPYATVEADLTGVYQKYSVLDHTGRMDVKTGSAVEQKCCALQHWICQWTNGNLLLSRLEGVDTKITNVGISVKSTGHQGLSVEGNPKVFEQFVSQHQCNYFCGLLGLRSLKVMDSLLTPTKPKGSRSPLLQRKMAAGSSSPQTGRKAAGSPRLPRKAEQEGRKTPTGQKAADAPGVVKMA